MSAYLLDLIKNILLISLVLTRHNVLWGIFFSKVQGYSPTSPLPHHRRRILGLFWWQYHEDIVSESPLTPITVPAAPPGPLLSETHIDPVVLQWFAVMLFLYCLLSNNRDTGRTSKPTMKWAHPQLRWWWTNWDATQTPVVDFLFSINTGASWTAWWGQQCHHPGSVTVQHAGIMISKCDFLCSR